MTYKCPYCGSVLAPDPEKDTQKPGRLRCPKCGDWWRAGRNGRLQKAQRQPTVSQMLAAWDDQRR